MDLKNYGLYQTLDYATSKKDISSAEKKTLKKRLSSLETHEKEAVILLICEHARIHDEYIFDGSLLELPYKCVSKKSEFHFSINKLPIKLRWILQKFMEVIDN